jgi:hypothetical protein
MTPIEVREFFAIGDKTVISLPFGAEVAARAFRTWDILGVAARPVSGFVKEEFQTTWKKLEYLTPLSWNAIPKGIKEHPLLKEVSLWS